AKLLVRLYQWRAFSRRSSAVEHPLRKRVVGGSNPSAGTSLPVLPSPVLRDQHDVAGGQHMSELPHRVIVDGEQQHAVAGAVAVGIQRQLSGAGVVDERGI